MKQGTSGTYGNESLPNITGSMAANSMRVCLFGDLHNGVITHGSTTSSKYVGGYGPETVGFS